MSDGWKVAQGRPGEGDRGRRASGEWEWECEWEWGCEWGACESEARREVCPSDMAECDKYVAGRCKRVVSDKSEQTALIALRERCMRLRG